MAKAKQNKAFDRLNESLEAAEKAAMALRDDIGAGGRDLLKDLDRMITAARRDAAKLTKSVRGDIAELQKAIAKQPNGNKPASKATPKTAPKKAARKSPAKAKAKAKAKA
jgi:hypothetical protein